MRGIVRIKERSLKLVSLTREVLIDVKKKNQFGDWT